MLPLALSSTAHRKYESMAHRRYLLLWLRAKMATIMTYSCTAHFIIHWGCNQAVCVQLCPSHSNSQALNYCTGLWLLEKTLSGLSCLLLARQCILLQVLLRAAAVDFSPSRDETTIFYQAAYNQCKPGLAQVPSKRSICWKPRKTKSFPFSLHHL